MNEHRQSAAAKGISERRAKPDHSAQETQYMNSGVLVMRKSISKPNKALSRMG